ncbi:leucine-rich repeat-containing protein 58 [Homalodisca vitripennis]|uniref:Leucine-rich repeat-containing protein 58 n=1 Tax=Homalodisca liturata TaxID=320908 RepID=A0A1B6JHN5_9HEMI|nr:leucine-rich repeat-containing protein 58 [Homalodisca vitripennis]
MYRYSESSSSDSDGLSGNEKTVDLSHRSLDFQTLALYFDEYKNSEENEFNPEGVHTLILYQNHLVDVPTNIAIFRNLKVVDISSNRLKRIPDILLSFPLTSLIAKNNLLENDSLPKSFESVSKTLTNFNLSGNSLTYFPPQILEAKNLLYVYLGGNRIEEIPNEISNLSRLQVLSLGGNHLSDIHPAVGQLKDLKALILSDNQLESLPAAIANLKNLKTLQLHKNRLRTLPTEIISLKCLSELSLRDNPLVCSFVNDMTYNPPSLLEVAARSIKVNRIQYDARDLPYSLREYLNSAHHCVNPKCQGVFFDNRVEHIKFVDFCGKYRVPLLQYLCSSKCIMNNTAIQHHGHADMMKKVLLG